MSKKKIVDNKIPRDYSLDYDALRLTYYKGVDRLLRQEYERCTTKEERKIVLEKIKANIEAYKKEKESQMRLKLLK